MQVDLGAVFGPTLLKVRQSSLSTLEVGDALPNQVVEVLPMQLRTVVLHWQTKSHVVL